MHSLQASTKNELTKLLLRKKAIFFMALTVLVPFLAAPLLHQLQNGLGITAIGSADYPITILNGLTLFVLPLLLFMSASDLFSGEFGDKTIRLTLVRPITRFKVYASKNIALFIMTLLYLAAAFAASTAASLLIESQTFRASSIGHSLLAYGAAALPMFTLSIIAVFIAQFFKNASGALAVCLLAYVGLKVAAFLFPQFTVYSPTAYTDWYQLWIGSAMVIQKIAVIFIFLAGWSIVFFTSGYYFFDKKEV